MARLADAFAHSHIFCRKCRHVCALTAFLQELQLELEAVRLRLLRRSQIIDVLRSAYVRDVVMVKNELLRKASMPDEVHLFQAENIRCRTTVLRSNEVQQQ